MGHYEDVLNHIAEPGAPDERAVTTSVTLERYEAEWFRDVLREWAEYEADSPHSEIALGYEDYIVQQLDRAQNGAVTLHAHTFAAIEVLEEAPEFGAENATAILERLLGVRISERVDGMRSRYVGYDR